MTPRGERKGIGCGFRGDMKGRLSGGLSAKVHLMMTKGLDRPQRTPVLITRSGQCYFRPSHLVYIFAVHIVEIYPSIVMLRSLVRAMVHLISSVFRSSSRNSMPLAALAISILLNCHFLLNDVAVRTIPIVGSVSQYPSCYTLRSTYLRVGVKSQVSN